MVGVSCRAGYAVCWCVRCWGGVPEYQCVGRLQVVDVGLDLTLPRLESHKLTEYAIQVMATVSPQAQCSCCL